MIFETVCYVLFISLIVYFLTAQSPVRRRGVYSRPGKWYYLKFTIIYVLLRLKKWYSDRAEDSSVEGRIGFNLSAGYGKKSKSDDILLDTVQDLPPEHPKAVDAVYFSSGSKEGQYFVGAIARRHKNLRQTLLYIRIPDLGVLELPSLPDTNIYINEANDDAYAADNYVIKPVVPFKTWQHSFNGKMRLIKPDESEVICNVKFELLWEASHPYFDFDADQNICVLAEAIAKEPWSKDFFKLLQSAHQTHHEQFGELSGCVEVEGQAAGVPFRTQGVRDHTFGAVRDWSSIHRYILQYVYLEDGTVILVGLVSMPNLLSGLPIGYVQLKDGNTFSVSEVAVQLWDFGDDGEPIKHFGFSFKANNKMYHLSCSTICQRCFNIGESREGRVYERMCVYTVNGVDGWGISEWEYRNYSVK